MKKLILILAIASLFACEKKEEQERIERKENAIYIHKEGYTEIYTLTAVELHYNNKQNCTIK